MLLSEAGKDATESFEDIGHSEDARAQLKNFHIGRLIDMENVPKEKHSVGAEQKSSGGPYVSAAMHPPFAHPAQPAGAHHRDRRPRRLRCVPLLHQVSSPSADCRALQFLQHVSLPEGFFGVCL